MAVKYIIDGGQKLEGEVDITGAKNATWKLMVAATLTDEEVTITNAARVLDVDIAAEIITSLGGTVTWVGKNTVKVCGKGINSYVVDEKFAAASRASLLFLGPLLYRFGKADIPLPGGDRIGHRPIDRHIEAFQALGVFFNKTDNRVTASTKGLKEALYKFSKNTHTGTENILIAASVTAGQTIIQNAALEPEVDNLILLLNKMGSKIVRAGRTIEIQGSDNLKGAEVEVIADRNQVVTFACAALVTNGSIVVKNVIETHLTAFLEKLTVIGAGWDWLDGDNGKKHLKIYLKSGLKPLDIETEVYPGFMSDWQALWAVVMTQAQGDSIIHERIFENRFAYTEILKKMGAKIELFNPKVSNPDQFYNFNSEDIKTGYRAVRISGPTQLHGIDYEVDDLRAGATIVLAALAASGVSTITGVDQIERGYQDFETKLELLGARIRVE